MSNKKEQALISNQDWFILRNKLKNAGENIKSAVLLHILSVFMLMVTCFYGISQVLLKFVVTQNFRRLEDELLIFSLLGGVTSLLIIIAWIKSYYAGVRLVDASNMQLKVDVFTEWSKTSNQDNEQTQLSNNIKSVGNTFQEILENGSTIQIESIGNTFIQLGLRVFNSEGKISTENKHVLKNGKVIILENGFITSVLSQVKYKTDQGVLILEQKDINGASKGDHATLDGNYINSCVFKTSQIEKIYIDNSIVSKRTLLGL